MRRWFWIAILYETLAALDALGPTAKDAFPAVEELLHKTPPDPLALLNLK